jgi:hypothetical protein
MQNNAWPELLKSTPLIEITTKAFGFNKTMILLSSYICNFFEIIDDLSKTFKASVILYVKQD